MSAGTETIPNFCAVCHATSDREPMLDQGTYHPYWLCVDQRACTDRAQAQQRAASDAVRRAVEAEKAALEPMKVITDAVVADIQDLAASASAHPDTPEDGEAAR